MTIPAETPEKEKSKNAPRQDYYNQNVCFAVIFGAFMVMLFFRADDAFGAVGLRDIYTIGSIITFVAACMVIVALFGAWRVISPEVAGAVIGIMLLFAVVINRDLFFLVIVGWMTSIAGVVLPGAVFAGGALLTLAAGFLCARFKRRVDSALMKVVTLAVLVFLLAYLPAISAIHGESNFVGSEQLNEHHYFLRLYHGWLGDPDALDLYECNVWAIACEKIYDSPPLPYASYTEVQLVSDPNTSAISVVVDGKPIYTHHPE